MGNRWQELNDMLEAELDAKQEELYLENPQTPKGAFVAYKVIDLYPRPHESRRLVILQLEVPADARRVLTDTGVLRVSKALPVELLTHKHVPYKLQPGEDVLYPPFQYYPPYEVGVMYEVDRIDLNPDNDCSYGINCFYSFHEAVRYANAEFGAKSFHRFAENLPTAY